MRRTIEKHLKEHIKDYFILAMILLVGIIIGIIVLNNTGDAQKEQINGYLVDLTKDIKESSKVDYFAILKSSIFNNLKFAIILVFICLSVFGVAGAYLLIGYKGFCLGYTLSSTIAIFGVGKGLLYGTSLVLLSNIIYIPALFYLTISSLKLYKNIKEQSRDERRNEIIKYLITLAIFFVLMLVSSLITTYINSNMFLGVIKIY